MGSGEEELVWGVLVVSTSPFGQLCSAWMFRGAGSHCIVSRKGVSSHGVISQINLFFAFLWSIRNEPQLRTEHARKVKVWGSEEEGEKTVLLPGEEKNPSFCCIACFDSKSCLYPRNCTCHSLCRFSLFFAAWGQSLRVICVRLVWTVLFQFWSYHAGCWHDFLCLFFFFIHGMQV